MGLLSNLINWRSNGLFDDDDEVTKYIVAVPCTRRLYLFGRMRTEETMEESVEKVYKEILSGYRRRIVSGEFMQSLGEIWNSEYHATNVRKLTPIRINVEEESDKNIISFFPETIEYILPLITNDMGGLKEKAIVWNRVFDVSYITFLEFHLFMRNDKNNVSFDESSIDCLCLKKSGLLLIYFKAKRNIIVGYLRFWIIIERLNFKVKDKKEENDIKISNMLDLASVFPMSREVYCSISRARKEICIWFDSKKISNQFLDLCVRKYINFFSQSIRKKMVMRKTNYNAIFTMKNEKLDYKIAFYIF